MMKTIIILSANNVHSANQKEGSENGDVLCSPIFPPRKKSLVGGSQQPSAAHCWGVLWVSRVSARTGGLDNEDKDEFVPAQKRQELQSKSGRLNSSRSPRRDRLREKESTG